MSNANEQYKPNIGDIRPSDILTRIKLRLILEVFIVIENNRTVAWKFEQQNIITPNELRNILAPQENYCNQWANKFAEIIATRDILDCIWRLCDHETSGVPAYSTNIRKIITEEFPTITFPVSSVARTTRVSLEPSIQSSFGTTNKAGSLTQDYDNKSTADSGLG